MEAVSEKNQPELRPKPDEGLDEARIPCYYAYPIYKDGAIEAQVRMDFDLPTRNGVEVKLQESNIHLRNLLLSVIDGGKLHLSSTIYFPIKTKGGETANI